MKIIDGAAKNARGQVIFIASNKSTIGGIVILALGLGFLTFVTDQVSAAQTANPDFATLLGLIPLVYIVGVVAGSVSAFLGKIPGLS